MTDAELIELVALMREYQKSYFSTKNYGDLQAAKDLERKVDLELARRQSAQGTLL